MKEYPTDGWSNYRERVLYWMLIDLLGLPMVSTLDEVRDAFLARSTYTKLQTEATEVFEGIKASKKDFFHLHQDLKGEQQ